MEIRKYFEMNENEKTTCQNIGMQKKSAHGEIYSCKCLY